MSTGWIKLHRQFRESPYYKEQNAKAVWIECLLRASHADNTVFLKRQQIFLKEGEFCMGREEFGVSIGMSGSTAWFWLLRFEVDRMVDIKKTAKGSIVSVKKWTEYQKVDSTIDNKKTADEQQMNTNKKEKNVKKNKETTVHMPEVLSEKESEFRNIIPLLSKVLGYEKIFTVDALKKWNSRRLSFSAEELLNAFNNLSKESDLWKIKNNGWRPLSWWLQSDSRIEEMLNCHLKRPVAEKGFIIAG